MPDPALKLNVEVKGAQAGVQQINSVTTATEKTAAAAAKSVGATTASATATKGLGEALAGLGSRNNDAKDVLEGVSAAANGGTGALFGVAKAARAAFAVFASGPVGIVVAGLALIGTAALALSDKFGKPKKSAEELAKEIETAKQRADELAKARVEQLNTDLAAIKNQASEAVKELDAVLAAQQRIADAQKNAALAENRNDTTISETERTKREFAINDRFSKSDDERKLNALSGREKIAGETLGSSVQANSENEVEYRRKLAELNAVKDKQARLSDIENNRVAITGDDQQGIANQFSDLQSEAARLRKELANLNPEELEKEFNKLGATVQDGRNKIFAAEKELAASTNALDAERKTQAEVAKARGQEIASNQTKALKEATKTDIEKNQQRKTTKEEQDKLAREIDAAQAGGDYEKQGELTREFQRRQKLIDLEGPGPKAEAKPFTPQKFTTFAPDGKASAPAPGITAQPIVDEVKKQSEVEAEKAAQEQESIDAAAAAIAEATQKQPPPLDLSPVVQSQATYHQVNLQRHTTNEQRLEELARFVQTLSQQLANSRK